MVEISETLETPVVAGESCSSARPLPGLTETAAIVCGENFGKESHCQIAETRTAKTPMADHFRRRVNSLMRRPAPVVAPAKKGCSVDWRVALGLP
ncbi:MAG: hypothetical protein M3407_05480 [Acidobacteriota bacterium]|nr:hypothetical protein [Acidobacteriota bacterium]